MKKKYVFKESYFVRCKVFERSLTFTCMEITFSDAMLFIPIKNLKLVTDRVDLRRNNKTEFYGRIDNDLIDFCNKQLELGIINNLQSFNTLNTYALNKGRIQRHIRSVREMLNIQNIPFLVKRNLLLFINKLRYVRIICENCKNIEEAIQFVHERPFVCEIVSTSTDIWHVLNINATIKKTTQDKYLVEYTEEMLLMCENKAQIIVNSLADAKLHCEDLALRIMELKL